MNTNFDGSRACQGGWGRGRDRQVLKHVENRLKLSWNSHEQSGRNTVVRGREGVSSDTAVQPFFTDDLDEVIPRCRIRRVLRHKVFVSFTSQARMRVRERCVCVWRFSSRFRQKFIENRSRRGSASSIRLLPRQSAWHVLTSHRVLHSPNCVHIFGRNVHKLWPTEGPSIEHKYRDCGA